MSMPSTLEVCRTDLFEDVSELKKRYTPMIVDKVVRVREMYNLFLAYPNVADAEVVSQICKHYKVHRNTAYEDLRVVKALLPMLSTASRDFHRWRTNEMLQETYNMAVKRKDPKTMERVATSYGKLNRVDEEVEQSIPYEKLQRQPFVPTDDPRVLGIEPIPNIDVKIKEMIDKYSKETIDIDDVEYEDVDLEFDTLFADTENNDHDDTKTESLL